MKNNSPDKPDETSSDPAIGSSGSKNLPSTAAPAGAVYSRQVLERSESSISITTGPLPLPAILREYEEIAPGAAERIIKMAEKQMAHRHSIEKTPVESDVRRSRVGLLAGLVVALTCIVGGVISILFGHDWAGATVATTTVAALAGVFVYGTVSRQKERHEKLRSLTGAGPTHPEQ